MMFTGSGLVTIMSPHLPPVSSVRIRIGENISANCSASVSASTFAVMNPANRARATIMKITDEPFSLVQRLKAQGSNARETAIEGGGQAKGSAAVFRRVAPDFRHHE